MLFKRLKQLTKHTDYEKYLVSPEIISASHSKCQAIRINPDMTQIPQLVNHLDTFNLIESSRHLLSAAWPVIKDDLYPSFINEDQLIILCNHEGYAIALMSSPTALDLCSSMNISVGSCFREEACGTNAIALAIRQKQMVVVRGELHYCQLFKEWSCVAAPVRSPDGDIIGCLDISTDSEDELGPAPVSLQLAVKYVEAKMYAEKLLAEVTPKTSILPETLNKFGTLSPRERQVIRLMAEGQTASEVAETMEIGCETVKTHREKIYKKLGVNKKSDCLKKARELGLLDE
ncbi:MAG: response regulator transcription factor [Eubacteriales bacterium]